MIAWIIAGAVSGIIASVLANLLLRTPQSRRWQPLILVLGVVALTPLLKPVVAGLLPGRRLSNSQRDELLRSNPAIALLVEHHPELRASFNAFMDTVVATSTTRDEGFAKGLEWGRKTLSAYLLRYIPATSDTSLLAFATVFSEVLTKLQDNPEGCMAFLFGPAAGATSVPRFGQDLEAKMNTVMASVIQTAIDSPQPPVPADRGQSLVLAAIDSIRSRYGDAALNDLALLASPESARRSPAAACTAGARFYGSTLLLPPIDAAAALRHLFSQVAPK